MRFQNFLEANLEEKLDNRLLYQPNKITPEKRKLPSLDSEKPKDVQLEEQPYSTTVDGVLKKKRGRPKGSTAQPHWKKPGPKARANF